MQKFKGAFLTRFDGMDEGQLIRDRLTSTITFRQAASAHTKKVLQIYRDGAWDSTQAKTPLEPGVLLLKVDSPEQAFVDPNLHCRYRGITGHLSYLMTMMLCDLAFAYAKLSKFVQCPGPVHLKAAER
eukprot:2189818-Rhodomonas_salina.1